MTTDENKDYERLNIICGIHNVPEYYPEIIVISLTKKEKIVIFLFSIWEWIIKLFLFLIFMIGISFLVSGLAFLAGACFKAGNSW